MDTRVAVAIADKQVAVRRECQVGRVVEWWTGPQDSAKVHAGGTGVGCLAAGAQREEEPAIGRELADGVIHVVGTPDGIVGTAGDPVRPGEQAIAPRR